MPKSAFKKNMVRAPAREKAYEYLKAKIDGFVKSPTAALRFIFALLNSRYARRRSRFNGVNHCGVL